MASIRYPRVTMPSPRLFALRLPLLRLPAHARPQRTQLVQMVNMVKGMHARTPQRPVEENLLRKRRMKKAALPCGERRLKFEPYAVQRAKV